MMWLATPGSSELVQETVVAAQEMQAEGLFNVFTNEGPRCAPRW